MDDETHQAHDKILAVFMLLFIGIFFALLFIGMSNASAEKLIDDIGINISDSCVSLLKLGSEQCPDYQMILAVFHDTTKHEISGGFELTDGLYQRTNKHLNNHYEYYRTNGKTDVWINPPADVSTRIRMIDILPSLPDYKIKQNSTMMNLDSDSGQFIRYMGHTRYTSPDCKYSAISAENWLFNLGDTINLMNHNCDPNFTQLTTVTKITKQKSYQDISTSMDYQHKQWIKQIKDNCLSEYGKCNFNHLN